MHQHKQQKQIFECYENVFKVILLKCYHLASKSELLFIIIKY